MKSTLILAGMIGAASVGGFAFAAPAQASCSPSFTSIPCTIVTNVAQAPVVTASNLVVAPQQLADNLAVAPGQLFLSQGCPSVGNVTPPCGLPAAPGQLAGGLLAAPGQLATNLITAPQTLADSLAKAPGQLFKAVLNGGDGS
ncbi:hypothetical protein ACXPWS_25775 [Mycobacterium sp. BMJ-28]